MRIPNYKDFTYAQLRSFCETARLGSMSAAAEALGVAQPTIWKQIHSLEQHLGVSLLEAHPRGCRLTPAGELLLRLAGPLVGEVEAVPDRFRTALGKEARKLVVCATPRPFDEELLPCVIEFESRYPQVHLVARQVATRQHVIEDVLRGEADIGLCSLRYEVLPEGLQSEPLYPLDLVLLVPPGHPLARAKVRLQHLAQYPLLNVRNLYADWGVAAALEKVGAFDHPERRIELEMARSIRLYVRNGMGIGIVVRPQGITRDREVIERPLDLLLDRPMQMYAFYRRRLAEDRTLMQFLEVVRDTLHESYSK